jgi:hypothetical protein
MAAKFKVDKMADGRPLCMPAHMYLETSTSLDLLQTAKIPPHASINPKFPLTILYQPSPFRMRIPAYLPWDVTLETASSFGKIATLDLKEKAEAIIKILIDRLNFSNTKGCLCTHSMEDSCQ